MYIETEAARLLESLGLGAAVAPPAPVSGGLVHRMFRVVTDRGVYAVKALNPEVTARPGALQNIRDAEEIAAAFAERLPAVAALEIRGARLHARGGRWYGVYPWVEGRSVFPPRITAAHCAAVGDLLGRMHGAALRLPGIKPEPMSAPDVDWPTLIGDARRAARGDAAWLDRLQAHAAQLADWAGSAADATRRLAGTPVLSHCDLDPKNVLWTGLTPHAIDWEAAGYVHPRMELLTAALDWSADGRGGIVPDHARALLDAYEARVPARDGGWDDAFRAGRANPLEWLAYNVRRAAGLVCADAEEVRLGAAEVEKALDALDVYDGRIDALRSCVDHGKEGSHAV